MITESEAVGRNEKPQSVLVVDNDAPSRELLKALLAPLGVQVVELDRGGAAIGLLTAPDHKIDLVILDMMMPGCDGMQVLDTLAARELIPALPVLVVTAYEDRTMRRRALEAGAIDFIAKPVDRIELPAKCRTMLELSRLRATLEERDFLNQERFEAIVANAPVAISVRDAQARYTMVNNAFCQLFGKSSVADVIGRTEADILPPAVLDGSRRSVARLLAGESVIEEEAIPHGSDTISVLTQRFPLKSSAGAITEMVTVRTDITQRKEAERKAAERAIWKDRISAAISDGRLLVYSQPIVDVGTREVTEEELLVRLGDAATGKICPPSEFLPQCEQYHLLPMIDRYMVGRAIDLAAGGRHVCVNITGQTIGDAAPSLTSSRRSPTRGPMSPAESSSRSPRRQHSPRRRLPRRSPSVCALWAAGSHSTTSAPVTARSPNSGISISTN